MTEHAAHQAVAVHNFTAFSDVTLEFSRGINAFVGENGTGKTHVMKALYAFERTAARDDDIRQSLKDLFQVRALDSLLRQGASREHAQVDGQYSDGNWAFSIHKPDAMGWHLQGVPPPPRPVFIPAIDMLGHTRGFLQAASEVVLDFDLTCTDVVTLLGLERRNGDRQREVVALLSDLLGGTLEHEESTGRFYLVTSLGRLPMPLVAEGVRKIATLARLAENGWLAAGTTLFWDEPEVNLNPILMDDVFGALLAMARNGVQVFLATHSYVILKELDLQAQPTDSVRYFGFERTEDGTTVNATDDFTLLAPNSILDQYISLYDRELTRATGRNRRGERVR
jgi:predicted ATPase